MNVLFNEVLLLVVIMAIATVILANDPVSNEYLRSPLNQKQVEDFNMKVRQDVKKIKNKKTNLIMLEKKLDNSRQ